MTECARVFASSLVAALAASACLVAVVRPGADHGAADGAACVHDADCASGLCFNGAACVPNECPTGDECAAGEVCASIVCGTRCVVTPGDGDACRTATGFGDSCASVTLDAPCDGGLHCDVSEADDGAVHGTCAVPSGVGGSCAGGAVCADGLFCGCGVCRATPDACDVPGDVCTKQCRDMDTARFACTAPGGVGDVCDADIECGPQVHTCAAGVTCTVPCGVETCCG